MSDAFLQKVINYFLWYVFYSVLGWIAETVLFAVRDKKATKRGFLFGPLCPIYGTGAVICNIVFVDLLHLTDKFSGVKEFFVLFFAGLVLCDVLEYVTGYVLEKAFHTKWWDYSYQKFNLHGRISLYSSVLFGGGIALLLMVVQPFVTGVTESIMFGWRIGIAFVIYTILLVDFALTIQSLKSVVESLKEIQEYAVTNAQQSIDKTTEKASNYVDKIKSKSRIDNLVDEMKDEKSLVQKAKRFFPNVHIDKYKDAFDIIFSRNKDDKDDDSQDPSMKND